MSTNFFSSLSGSYDLNSSMSSLIGDYSQIKSGAYGSLMKSYVNKVGNKAALKAYQETGSTTTAADSSSASSSSTTTTASSKKSSSTKTNFLDSHLSSIKNSGVYTKSEILKKAKEAAAAEAEKTATADTQQAAASQTSIDTTV